MVDLGPLNIDKPGIPSLPTHIPVLSSPRAKREPLAINNPRAVSGYQNKYLAPDSYFQTLAAQYPEFATAAVQEFDVQRAAKGQAPLSEAQTQRALQTITTGDPATPEPKRGTGLFDLPGNLLADAGEILRSIPRLPAALYNEGKEFGKLLLYTQGGVSADRAPEQYKQLYADAGNNPLKLIGATAQLPGVRMLPGAFIAENLQEPSEFLRHPLYTGLDLLPAAGKLAQGSKVARAATEASRALESGLLEVPGRTARQIERMADNPLRNYLTNRLDESGSLLDEAGTGLATERRALGSAADYLMDTKPLRAYQRAFGREARDAVYLANHSLQRVRGIMTGDITPQAWETEVLNTAGSGMEEIARQTVAASEEVRKLAPGSSMADLYNKLQVGDYASMTDDQLAAAEIVRDLNTTIADWGAKNGKVVMFDGEVYDTATGSRLAQQQRDVDMTQRFNDIRRAITGEDTTVTPQSLIEGLREAITRPRKTTKLEGNTAANRTKNLEALSNKELNRIHRGTVAALTQRGYDTTGLKKAWRELKDNPHSYQAALDDLAQQTPTSPRSTMDDLVAALEPHKGKSKEGQRVTNLLESIAKGHTTEITRHLNELDRSAEWMTPELRDSVRHVRDTVKTLDRDFKGVSTDAVKKAKEALEKRQGESVPARFVPSVMKETKRKYLEANNLVQAEQIAAASDLAYMVGVPGFDEAMFRKMHKEVARTWKKMRDDGLDPQFLHTVTSSRANQLLHPQTGIIPLEPTVLKARTLDMTPAVQDVAVSLTDQARSYLTQHHTEIAVRNIVDAMGVDEATIRAKYMPTAERLHRTNPALTVDGHLQDLIAKNYRRFNPDTEGMNWGSPYLKKLSSDSPYVPISVYQNLKDLGSSKSLLGGVMDPITGLFRMATTSLSFRTQLYNAIGGAFVTELQNPGALLRSGRKAYKWMRDKDQIPDALRPVVGSQKHLLLDLDREAIGAVNTGAWAYMKGKALRRWYDESTALAKSQEPGMVRRGLRKATDFSYAINGAMDDFYRLTTYIDEFDRAKKAGKSATVAEAKAISTMRRTFQDWLSQTPFERAVMKSVFPFYGFMSYAMRFVMRYPIDHPVRVEMMAKVAKAEMEENDTLPSRFLSMLFFGGMGPTGAQNAVNAGPLNPFSDVANFMTIQGALGATNPLIQTVLQLAGVENGEASLYPSLRYDPETGRMGIKSGNPLTTLLENTIPQSALLTSLLGVNEDYNQMSRTDPAAATRMLASGLTIPILWRRYNVRQEEIKAELNRGEAMDKTREAAIKSGDWSEALAAYPSLQGYLDDMDKLSDAEIEPYRPLTADQIRSLPQTDKYSQVKPLDEQIREYGQQPSLQVQMPGYSPADAGIAMLSSRGGI